MVLPPSKRQKAPKKAWTRCPGFFQSLRVQQVAPTVSPVGSVGASALCAEEKQYCYKCIEKAK